MQKTKSLTHHLITIGGALSKRIDCLLMACERSFLRIWRYNPFSLTWCIFAAFYVIFSLYGLFFFCQNTMLGDVYGRSLYGEMVEGTAFKPFVYRQLIPGLTNVVVDITPQSIRASAEDLVETFKATNEYSQIKRHIPLLNGIFPVKGAHYSRLVTVSLIYVCIIGYMLALYILARAVFPAFKAVALLAPIIGVYAFSSFNVPNQYLSDIPSLFLSTACFYSIYKQQNRHLILAFFLSCINKETSIFLLLFFTLWSFRRMESSRFLKTWTVLAVIYITVKTSISIYYLNNRGVFLEGHMFDVLMGDIYARSGINKILFAAILFFLFTYKWQEKPLFLKYSLWLLLPIYIGYIYFGFPNEYRIFFDVHGPLVLLATHTLVVGTGLANASIFQKPLLKWPLKRNAI